MSDAVQRAREREGWAVRARRLADQAPARMGGTVQERLQAVAELTRASRLLADKPTPGYSRDQTPIRVVSLGRE